MKIKYKPEYSKEDIFTKIMFISTIIFYIFIIISMSIFVHNCVAEEQKEEPNTETTIESTVPETEPEITTDPETELITEEIETIPETESKTVAETELLVTEVTEEKAAAPVEDPVLYFDVPLEKDLQSHIFKLCETYGVDPAIVVAMIERESGFRPAVKGDNGRSYGLMQIQLRYHKERMKKIGVTDLLNPYHNVAVGIDLLGELSDRGKSLEWVLMAYNGGYGYADRNISAGTISNYAKSIMARSKELKKGMI